MMLLSGTTGICWEYWTSKSPGFYNIIALRSFEALNAQHAISKVGSLVQGLDGAAWNGQGITVCRLYVSLRIDLGDDS